MSQGQTAPVRWNEVAPCAHCGRVRSMRGVLCSRCYGTPELREAYRRVTLWSPRGVPDCNGVRPLPAEPTRCPPGSLAKVEVLAERAARRECLHHPDDVGWEGRASRVASVLVGLGDEEGEE